MTKYYPDISSNPNFPQLEEEIIRWWNEQKIFEKSLKGEGEFIFYDGPPFANGLPHYGHLLTGFIKDLVARYQTMCGKKVDRRFGWDCHGLPAEMGSEKELGISGKKAIEEFGVAQFNKHCKNSVLRYTKEWEEYVNRQARWVDFSNDYKTMDINYMESVIWIFKTLYDKGLIYKSMRVMPYSWACETPVSDFETRMDNSYREKHSKSVVIKFRLKTKPKVLGSIQGEDIRILVWTTTPWTLPSNLALAVGSNIEYSVFGKNNVYYIIASQLATRYEQEIGTELFAKCRGKDLVGLEYEPLFQYFAKHKNAFRIFDADFVTVEDGTGVVHIAPGFGEDDQKLCDQHSIELVCPVDSSGKFTDPVSDYKGIQVFETNDQIILYLKQNDLWVKTEQYIHNYPHCWRTDTPLIYKAVPSWYLSVTQIKDKMIRNNQQINWIPEHVKGGLFGKWLENARDWSISRNRYWGCPIPIWESDNPDYPHREVYGSIEEMEKAFNVKITDLHKPFIDSLTRPNPSDPTGKSKLRRVPEVLDCWFESGAMPYAQVHYPFENKQWFETHFPADFIVEYVAQTRGWFYTLMVLSSALFDKPPFLNCICHGVILGDGGQKLSKRLKNYADPNEIFNTLGADAMRWFMISSPVVKGQELIIDQDGSDIKKAMQSVIKPLWNAYNFFTIYANIDGVRAKQEFGSTNVLDRYIIAKSLVTLRKIKDSMDMYDTVTATKSIEEFLEVLNNWYIRRSRERFWSNDMTPDKIEAYNTLYTVLRLISTAAAPLLPLTTEMIYQGLTCSDLEKNKIESVHLEKFPECHDVVIEEKLIHSMERVRSACNAALHIRNKNGIRVRQPLSKVIFIGVSDNNFDDDLRRLVLDEINVKNWESLDKNLIQQYATFKLQLKLPMLGTRVPHKIKDLITALKNESWEINDKTNEVTVAGVLLNKDEYEFRLEPKADCQNNIATLDSHDALVFLDLNITDSLHTEGVARDIVRSIQQGRKESGLHIAERIKIIINSEDKSVVKAVNEWKIYIQDQTLALDLLINSWDNDTVRQAVYSQRILVDVWGVQSGLELYILRER